MEWLFNKELDHAAALGGAGEALRWVAAELEKAVYLDLDRRWCCLLLQYARDRGTADILPVIVRFLRVDTRGLTKPEIDENLALASEVWFSIQERGCKSNEDKASLALQFVLPGKNTPPLDVDLFGHPDFFQTKLMPILKGLRGQVYALLKDPAQEFFDGVVKSGVVASLLDTPEFAPTPAEIDEVCTKGGTLGKCLLMRFANGTQHRDSFLRELQKGSNMDARLYAFQALAEKDDGVPPLLAFLRGLHELPLSESVERAKRNGIGYIRNQAFRLRQSKDVQQFVREFLEREPVLDEDSLIKSGFRDAPGKLFPLESRGIIRYRDDSRKTAQSTLEYWATLHEK